MTDPDTPDLMQARLVLGLANYAPSDPGHWRGLVEDATAAEAAGFDRLVVPDHVVFGESLDDYSRPDLGGVQGGRQPTGADGHWLEPLTVLSHLSGRTSAIRLGTNILLAALRRPAVLAKTIATLDVLSEGRVDLGVGVGWQRAEYEAAGLDYAERGRLLDHSLEVCRSLWSEAHVSYESPELTFRGITSRPAPRQPGGVPIWISGTLNPPVVRRLTRFGSGWIPWGSDAREVESAIARMRELVADLGRDPSGLRVLVYVPLVGERSRVDLQRTFAPLGALVDAGATDFRVPVESPEDGLSIRGRFPEAVEAFRASIGTA